MLDKVDIPFEGDILTEFPKDMLMTKVRTNISSIFEDIKTSHIKAVEAMRSMKKLVTQIPAGAFRLFLQPTIQPHVMIQHHHL